MLSHSIGYYCRIGHRIGQIPGPAHWAEPGTLSTSGGLVSVMVACNRENVKSCFRFREPAMHGPHRMV